MRPTIAAGGWRRGRDDERVLQNLLYELRLVSNYLGRSKSTVQTALTAAATDLWSDTMPPNTAWDLDYRVVGRASDGDIAGYRLIARLVRGSSGAPTLLSSAAPVADHEDNAAWACALDATSTDGVVIIQVTGDATRTVDWTAVVDIVEVP